MNKTAEKQFEQGSNRQPSGYWTTRSSPRATAAPKMLQDAANELTQGTTAQSATRLSSTSHLRKLRTQTALHDNTTKKKSAS